MSDCILNAQIPDNRRHGNSLLYPERRVATRIHCSVSNPGRQRRGCAKSSSRDTQRKADGVDAPATASRCQSGGVGAPLREASVSQVTTIGLDIAKSLFHAHGNGERGVMVFNRKLTRTKLLDVLAGQRASLGARVAGDETRVTARPTGLCEVVHEAEQERCDRCGSELRSSVAPRHALRCGGERGTAGCPPCVPDARSGDASAHPVHQSDPRAFGRVWLGSTTRNGARDDVRRSA